MAVSLLTFIMQKYNIFTKYHSVLITNQPLKILNVEGKQIIECNKNNFLQIPFSSLLEEKPNQKSIIVYVTDIDASIVFLHVIKSYVFVQAAGGLVRNQYDELLFIFRNNKWDLPKGHKEIGEDIEETALREVREECGLNDLEIVNPLGITYHTYYMNGRHELKETHWYNMKTTEMNLIAQKEEGIEKAAWIGRDKIDEVVKDCFLSLRNLLENT
ncbi:MAG TPA: hypothetical protein DD434_00240, partial [Bacteroidales bacterium]|nr:hypothetical protein [Bacteroidales bacterium]